MKRLLRSLALASLLLPTATVVRAQLTLHIDTSAETLWFDGTTSGDGFLITGNNIYGVAWVDVTAPGNVGESNSLDSLFTSSVTMNFIQMGYQTEVGDTGLFINAAWNLVEGSANTITGLGSGVTLDYSSWGSDMKTEMAHLSGLALDTVFFPATGFNDIAVSISAVPEPSAYALFAGVAFLGFSAWRRRRRALAPQ